MDRVITFIRSAEDFARQKHAKQKRKWTNVPYWHHLQEVARKLLDYGATPDVIAGGWLHDTIEDTDATYQELCRHFGHVVANLVIEVTDVSNKHSGNTPEGVGNRILRKQIDRQYLAGASARGQMIKCADIISNTRDISIHGGNFARVYVPEKKLLIDVLDKARAANYGLWREAFDSITKAEQVLSAAA